MQARKDEEVKKAILEAARAVFKKWGLNKTTMEDIAQEAGKGKSTLYYYYKSKEEIFESVVAKEFSDMLDNAKAQVENIKSAKEKLKKYIIAILREIKKTVNIYPIVQGEIKGNKEFIQRIQKKLDDKEGLIIKEILKQGLETEEFHTISESELDKATTVVVGIIRGFELYLFLDNDDKEKIDIATRMIASGI